MKVVINENLRKKAYWQEINTVKQGKTQRETVISDN